MLKWLVTLPRFEIGQIFYQIEDMPVNTGYKCAESHKMHKILVHHTFLSQSGAKVTLSTFTSPLLYVVSKHWLLLQCQILF